MFAAGMFHTFEIWEICQWDIRSRAFCHILHGDAAVSAIKMSCFLRYFGDLLMGPATFRVQEYIGRRHQPGCRIDNEYWKLLSNLGERCS